MTAFSPDHAGVVPKFYKPFFNCRLFFIQFLVQDAGVGRNYHVLPGVADKLTFPYRAVDISEGDVTL